MILHVECSQLSILILIVSQYSILFCDIRLSRFTRFLVLYACSISFKELKMTHISKILVISNVFVYQLSSTT